MGQQKISGAHGSDTQKTMATLKQHLAEHWEAEDWEVCLAICIEMQLRKAGLHDEPKEDESDV